MQIIVQLCIIKDRNKFIETSQAKFVSQSLAIQNQDSSLQPCHLVVEEVFDVLLFLEEFDLEFVMRDITMMGKQKIIICKRNTIIQQLGLS